MREWYTSNLGRQLIDTERTLLGSILPDLFGYHLLQIGLLAETDLLASSRIHHRVVVDPVVGMEVERGGSPLFASTTALPILSNSVDVVVLHHTLEFERHPHQVLREAERVLIPEGNLVLLCFNPGSLWGVERLVAGWRESPPWCGHFFTLTRIKDWLKLLGFDLVMTRGYFFRPPLRGTRLMARLQFMERLGERWWPLLGAGFVVVARKRVHSMTPIRPRWRRSRMMAGGLEPTVRRGHS